jgi:hypothetical protein
MPLDAMTVQASFGDGVTNKGLFAVGSELERSLDGGFDSSKSAAVRGPEPAPVRPTTRRIQEPGNMFDAQRGRVKWEMEQGEQGGPGQVKPPIFKAGGLFNIGTTLESEGDSEGLHASVKQAAGIGGAIGGMLTRIIHESGNS